MMERSTNIDVIKVQTEPTIVTVTSSSSTITITIAPTKEASMFKLNV
jgi:hypothetical protein